MKTALVTAIGSYAADIVIKNLKKIGLRIVGTDIYRKEWIADAYNINAFYQVPQFAEAAAYLREVKSICEREHVDFILPMTDNEVDIYNQHRDWFEARNICLCISSSETLRICRNKKLLQEFIDQSQVEIQTIPTRMLTDCPKPPFDFPMVCKPFDGRSSQGLRYVQNEMDFYSIASDENAKKMVIQPYIEGSVVTVDVVRSVGGAVTVALPRLELLRTLNGAGTSVKVFPDDDLEQKCIALANALDVIGCINFEFMVDGGGKYHFIECNPRFSGGVEFSCLAGYDCVCNHIRCFTGKPIDSFKLQRSMYIARKFEEFVTRIEPSF